jgi:hypothetical protein
MTSSTEKMISLLIVVAIVVIIVFLIKKNRKIAEPQLPAKVPEETKDIGNTIHTTSYNTNATLAEEAATSENPQAPTSESFTTVLTKESRVTDGGDIVAPRIFTDGYSPNKIDLYKKAIMNGTEIDAEVPKQELAVKLGDNFAGVFDKHVEFVNNKEGDGTIKSNEELSELSKNIGVHSNSSNFMMSRGGSGKAKLVLDPLGTAGVMDVDKLPERQKDHKIRMVSQMIHIPDFSIDSNNITEDITANRGWSKNLAPKTEQKIVLNGGTANESVSISVGTAGDQSVESFSYSGF